MKLLVADDSLVVRNAIARSVKSGAISEVLRAEDGNQAVELFQEHLPDEVPPDSSACRSHRWEKRKNHPYVFCRRSQCLNRLD